MIEHPKQRAVGRINVTSFDARPYDTEGIFSISEANVTEEFSGGLVGVGTARFIMVKGPGDEAHFTGMERVRGKLCDRSGSFVFRNSGTLKDGVLESTWLVILGSGTEDLAGLRGEGGCTPEGYSLNYWFE